MTYEEFKRRLGKAGLSVREFAELVHVSGNSVTNYASKNFVPNHLAVAAVLMSEMAESGLDFRLPLSCLDAKERKSRGLAKREIGLQKQQNLL